MRSYLPWFILLYKPEKEVENLKRSDLAIYPLAGRFQPRSKYPDS